MHRITVLVPFVVLLASVAGCSSVSEAQPVEETPAVRVRVASAGEIEVPRTLSLTGTLTAAQEAEVAADVTGRVLSTSVERGDLVERGETLALVDVSAASMQASEARAQLEAARADDAQARLECSRSQTLWERRAISDGERDRDQARCEASSWTVRAAEARVRLMQKSIGDGVVRAPFRGLVAERNITAGEYVRPDTRVVTLLDVDTLRLELVVPEADALSVEVGQTVRFQVAALPGESFEGTIRYLGQAVRRDSRDLTVEAVVLNLDGRLRPGMFAVSEVDLGQVRRVAVPREAVRMEDETAHVFVARSGRLEERVVRLGPESGSQVTVLEGLSRGERVVSPVEAEHVDGIEIEIVRAASGR